MECIYDLNLIPDNHVKKKKNIVYAGKLHKEFGMELLAESIPLIDNTFQIHIYGDGNYKEELIKIAERYDNVFIHDVVTADEIIRIECESMLLINPRTRSDFTKYSFPSKTVEYMATGVPVVMFRLEGIPEEYNNYIFFAENETPEAFANKINEVLHLDSGIIEAIGKKAKEYVICNKNCHVQGKRIIDFIS